MTWSAWSPAVTACTLIALKYLYKLVKFHTGKLMSYGGDQKKKGSSCSQRAKNTSEMPRGRLPTYTSVSFFLSPKKKNRIKKADVRLEDSKELKSDKVTHFLQCENTHIPTSIPPLVNNDWLHCTQSFSKYLSTLWRRSSVSAGLGHHCLQGRSSLSGGQRQSPAYQESSGADETLGSVWANGVLFQS